MLDAWCTGSSSAQQRTASLQAQRVLLQTNLRSAAAFISTELREVSTDSANPDLLAFSCRISDLSRHPRKRDGLRPESDIEWIFLALFMAPFGGRRPAATACSSLWVPDLAESGSAGPVIGVGIVELWRKLIAADLHAARFELPSRLPQSVRCFPSELFEIMQIKLYQSQGVTGWAPARSVLERSFSRYSARSIATASQSHSGILLVLSPPSRSRCDRARS